MFERTCDQSLLILFDRRKSVYTVWSRGQNDMEHEKKKECITQNTHPDSDPREWWSFLGSRFKGEMRYDQREREKDWMNEWAGKDCLLFFLRRREQLLFFFSSSSVLSMQESKVSRDRGKEEKRREEERDREWETRRPKDSMSELKFSSERREEETLGSCPTFFLFFFSRRQLHFPLRSYSPSVWMCVFGLLVSPLYVLFPSFLSLSFRWPCLTTQLMSFWMLHVLLSISLRPSLSFPCCLFFHWWRTGMDYNVSLFLLSSLPTTGAETKSVVVDS